MRRGGPQDLFVVTRRAAGSGGTPDREAVWADSAERAAAAVRARGDEVLDARPATYAERCAVGQTGRLAPLVRCPGCKYPFDGLDPDDAGAMTCPECGRTTDSPLP